jgi:two-component system NtrC family sensor kinase
VSGENILVVDDSAQIRNFLVKVVLEPEGYAVTAARNGAEGLTAAFASAPDLIITDFAMTDMTGLEMVREMQKSGQHFPTILITAEGSEDIAVEALRLGIADYFVKPFDPIALREAVRRVLDASRSSGADPAVPGERHPAALSALISIGKAITGLRELDLILDRVVEAAVYLSGTESGALMLVAGDGASLHVRAVHRLERDLRTVQLPLESLPGRVVKSGQPLMVSGENVKTIAAGYQGRSLLFMPLKMGETVLGLLGVHNLSAGREIPHEEVGIVAALADYAAIAISNAHLCAGASDESTPVNQILWDVDIALLVVDSSNRLLVANPAARQLLGLSRDMAAGGQPLELICRDEKLKTLLSAGSLPDRVTLDSGKTYTLHSGSRSDTRRTLLLAPVLPLEHASGPADPR